MLGSLLETLTGHLGSAGLACFALLAQAAQAADPAAGPAPQDPGAEPASNPWGMVPMIAVMVGIFYFLFLRPQKARETEEKSMLERLKKNDKVVTKGGLYGIVMNVKDDEVTLKIDEQQNVKVRYQKSAIAAILGEDDGSKSEDKKA